MKHIIKKVARAVTATTFIMTGTVAQAADCKAVYGEGETTFRLATGSPGELGLLKALADEFNTQHDSSMCWIKAGSGKSLKLLKAGKVDMVMVHAPGPEKEAIQAGWADQRTLIGSNEFYLAGPASDPANVNKTKTIAEAYSRIAQQKANFFSRGDNSGTHKKEMRIWGQAGIKPAGDWYLETKDFMRATLRQANNKPGYFMTDSSTWVAEQSELSNLKILFKGDPLLINTYHALRSVDLSRKETRLSEAFIDFVASDKGQQIITEFGQSQFGSAMYNNAQYAQKFVH
ncbi:substrate-binding domain-containing protein [Oceanospirillum sediminis]|uniref:Substrate-binding domain-containing protein n=1 Tax=Oceanospirillum sediminis TaxID=2760088 RepID=A0A839IXE7_9GAMM|nr:substrate-binding domain-containing protein [Oceanospirillum sediminis]MBB1489628.1 substrate-binding domain-containing protein [Oceanospirillum sediminis]